ncbi:MAG: hypothetical protein ACI9I0_002114 [Rhodoferax sp.]|jgi:hypothetical protein
MATSVSPRLSRCRCAGCLELLATDRPSVANGSCDGNATLTKELFEQIARLIEYALPALGAEDLASA